MALQTDKGTLVWNQDTNTLVFYFDCPMPYDTEVKIEARANSNTSSRDMQAYVVELTKES